MNADPRSDVSSGSARLTIGVLRLSQIVAGGLFVAALLLQVLGSNLAESLAVPGVIVVIATPALSLLATYAESWRRDRAVAVLAAAVLAVLAVATGVALFLGR